MSAWLLRLREVAALPTRRGSRSLGHGKDVAGPLPALVPLSGVACGRLLADGGDCGPDPYRAAPPCLGSLSASSGG